MTVHSDHSSYREKLLEHLFIGELLRHLWSRGVTTADFLRPEVDAGGYDLVISCNRVIRHIQLKASFRGAKTARQKIGLRLGDQPSGCVVWIRFDARTLDLGPFLWFGGAPGEPLPDIQSFPVAKHTKGNSRGVKAELPMQRIVKKGQFERLRTIQELVDRMFGDLAPVSVGAESEDTPPVPRADDVRAVLSFLPALASPDFDTGKVHCERLADGAMTMPMHVHGPELDGFIDALHQHGFIRPFDWTAWQAHAQRYVNDSTLLQEADMETICKLLTTHVRKDRFCDGHFADMVECGHVTAILRRLKHLI